MKPYVVIILGVATAFVKQLLVALLDPAREDNPVEAHHGVEAFPDHVHLRPAKREVKSIVAHGRHAFGVIHVEWALQSAAARTPIVHSPVESTAITVSGTSSSTTAYRKFPLRRCNGERVFLGYMPTLEACETHFLTTAACGTAFEWDTANQGWCGCGLRGTPNADCNLEWHQSSTVFRTEGGGPRTSRPPSSAMLSVFPAAPRGVGKPAAAIQVQYKDRRYSFVVHEHTHCGSSREQDRVFLGKGALQRCAILFLQSDRCGSAFEWDGTNGGWCGCGRADTANRGCRMHGAARAGWHATSRVFELSSD
mmetsp:Transcript_27319/g.79998  ORF Transcript_27319/g.79998 Transcript_27319/m.79998 type:complete len:309 (+) Transcript_27319:3-929(+)